MCVCVCVCACVCFVVVVFLLNHCMEYFVQNIFVWMEWGGGGQGGRGRQEFQPQLGGSKTIAKLSNIAN